MQGFSGSQGALNLIMAPGSPFDKLRTGPLRLAPDGVVGDAGVWFDSALRRLRAGSP